MYGLIAWFARNDVAANILMVVIMLAGLYTLKTAIPFDMFPESDIDTVSVKMSLRGASPQEVEEGLTIRIEEAIQDLDGIERINSASTEGNATVIIEVEDGYDVRDMLEEVKLRVDAINNFPADAERPLVSTPQRRIDAIAVILYGDYDALTLRRYAEDVRDDIANLPEVTQVVLDNVLPFEISIEISEYDLRKYGLTLEQVANELRRNAIDVSAGNLKTDGGEIFIRSRGQAYRAEEYAQIPILTSTDGTLIRLGDIADLRDEFEEIPLSMKFNGKPAIEIEIFRTGDQSIIDVTTAVRNYLDAKQDQLPNGLYMTYWRDRSAPVKARLTTLANSAWQGGMLVIILLALFLRPAVAFWVCLGIPMCFMGAFIVMPLFGITLNLMSLFAFILVLGIVVDDAIVTGENVYAHLQEGYDPLKAAIEGTQEVSIPVTFGILTTVAAFMPLAFIEGQGSWYRDIPFIVMPVLVFSLVESKLVLPAHLKHVRPRKDHGSKLTLIQRKISNSLELFIENYYQPFLAKAMRWRYATLSAMAALFIVILGAIMSGQTKFVWFPKVASEVARVNLVMPTGTPFESTDRIVNYMADKAAELQEKYVDPDTGESVISNIYSVSGGRNSSTGRVRVEIVPPEMRTMKITSLEILNEWRQNVGQVAGAEELNYRAQIGWTRSPINIELRSKNTDELSLLSESLKSHLSGYNSVFDIEDTLSRGKEELQLSLKPEATLLGINLNTLAKQVRQAVYGYEVQRIQRGREEVRVMVRYPIEARQNIETLEQMMLRLDNRTEVPLWQVAEVKPGISPVAITRIDRQRTLTVKADFNKQTGDLTAVQREVNAWLANEVLNYPGASYAMTGEAKDTQESSNSLLTGFIGLLLLIYVLLAIPFKSYAQPLIVMMTIPFGVVGAVMGHWIMGMDLTLLSMMGMLALSGVVVNDSLVLVDFINSKRKEGVRIFEAVYMAGGRRFRPVLLTSVTTFAGLMPLLFEKSTQAQFLIPMAVSLGFGILFATLITLILVPINYLILEDIKSYFKRYRQDMGWLIRQQFNKSES